MSTGNTESTPQPTPHFEAAPPPVGTERANEQAMERPAAPETQQPSSQPKPAANRPVAAPVAPAAPPPLAPATDTSQQKPVSDHTKDLHAEESDLIEKEWVQRAKHIVTATQDDPYKQKSEISKAKADYIQKRFNKTIKVDDAAVS